jgi:hypothetical protein
MGWPEHWNAAAREHLLKASKMQTQMIDQITDAWEQQLKSPSALKGAAMLPMPALSASGSSDAMSEMMRFWTMFLLSSSGWRLPNNGSANGWLPNPARTCGHGRTRRLREVVEKRKLAWVTTCQ